MIPIRPRNGPARPRDDQARPRTSGGDPRPRRNSDSSVLERPAADDERKERERRRREREARNREREESSSAKPAAEISASRSVRSRKKAVHVDVVDQMDVTGGLYGVSGSKFCCLLPSNANKASVASRWTL
jgi:hypothetical protein